MANRDPRLPPIPMTSHTALHLSDKFYRSKCPFSTATHDDNYAGDKHFVFDKNGDLVSSFATKQIADQVAEQMNELAAKALLTEGTKAEGL